eukprot:334115-Chlamydomonas_euryale.AAC.1
MHLHASDKRRDKCACNVHSAGACAHAWMRMCTCMPTTGGATNVHAIPQAHVHMHASACAHACMCETGDACKPLRSQGHSFHLSCPQHVRAHHPDASTAI